MKQLLGVAKTLSQNRTQQRTEEVIDAPVLQVVEELVEVSQVFSQNTVYQRFGEQTTETPDISFVDKIVEMLVTQTQEKTQQVANTHVQHVVNTVKVLKPKIIQAETAETRHPGEDQPGNQAHRGSTVPERGLLTCSMLCNDRYPWSRRFRRSWRIQGC